MEPGSRLPGSCFTIGTERDRKRGGGPEITHTRHARAPRARAARPALKKHYKIPRATTLAARPRKKVPLKEHSTNSHTHALSHTHIRTLPRRRDHLRHLVQRKGSTNYPALELTYLCGLCADLGMPRRQGRRDRSLPVLPRQLSGAQLSAPSPGRSARQLQPLGTECEHGGDQAEAAGDSSRAVPA